MTKTQAAPRTGSTFSLNGRKFQVVTVRGDVIWYRDAAGRGNVEQMALAKFTA